ncbi:MAG: hypothetical protein GXC78_15070 [Chitinophagaceae bacterium]|nr:hypothetical protein [Chitinophagaceae bacterium]
MVLAAVLLTTIPACHRKSGPQITDRTDIPARPMPATTSMAGAADIEAGKQIYTVGKCTKCHEAKPVDNWTAEQWKPILKSMIPKAKLDSLQRAQVTAYVNLHARKG